MTIVKLIIAILATWRIAASIYYGKEFEGLRYRLTAVTDDNDIPLSWVGRQLSCFWCVSFWVGCVVAPVAWVAWVALLPFALSGGAILLAGGSRTLWREIQG